MPITLAERVARLEVGLADLTRQISRELDVASSIHEATERSINRLTNLAEKLDARQDRVERQIARLLGALGVLVVVVNLLAPVVLRWLGVQ